MLIGIFEAKHCVVDGDFVFIFGEMLILGVVCVLAFLSINLAQLFMTKLMILRRNSVRQRDYKYGDCKVKRNARFGASVESRRSNQVGDLRVSL